MRNVFVRDVELHKAAAPEKREGSPPLVRDDRGIQVISRRIVEKATIVKRYKSRYLSLLPVSFFLFVILLPSIYGAYLIGVASPRYETEFRATVKSAQSSQGGLSMLLGLGLGGQSATDNDANAIVQYLKSASALDDIGEAIDLRSKFSASSIDFFSRLEADSTTEELLRYWKTVIKADFEHSTSTITVRVEAFSPEDSLLIAQAALAKSEALINKMSDQARRELVSFSEREVKAAEERLAKASSELTLVMDQTGTLNPEMSAQSLTSSATRLRDELSKLNAILTLQRTTMSESAPPVIQTKARISAAEQELKKLNDLITGSGEHGKALSASLTAFTLAETERGFAEKAYQGALASLETAKLDASRRQAYLATIVAPHLAQEESFPRPLLATATAALLSLLGWVIAVVTGYAIKEHL